MGFDKVIFFDPLPMELICTHCGDVLQNAKASPCGHILCTSCFVIKGHGKLICPVCPHPQALLKRSKFIKLIEIDDQISKLSTWCNFEGCHEHFPLNQRGNHLKECPRRNDIKKRHVNVDLIDSDAESDHETQRREEEDEKRKKRKKKILIRIAVSACLYGVLAMSGIPGDSLITGIPWCDVTSAAQYAPGF